MGWEDIKTKVLSSLPAWQDFFFISRYPRKRGMVAGWLHLVALILAIVGAASSSWLMEESFVQVPTRAGFANITTRSNYGLTRYSVIKRIDSNNGTYWTGESGAVADVIDLGSLADLSAVTLTFIIICIVATPVSAGFVFYHGWARGNPRVMYIVSCSLTGAITLLMLLGYILYAAVMPKDEGFYMGWGFWVTFFATLFYMGIFFVVLSMKPEGIPYYKKQSADDNVVAMEATAGTAKSSPPQRAAASTATTTRSAPKPSPSADHHKVPQKKPPPPPPSTRPPAKKGGSATKKMLRAKFDCEAEQEGDLAFKAGDMIELVSEEPGDGWLTGKINGNVGILPENYIERV